MSALQKKIIISLNQTGQRLDKFLIQEFNNFSRSEIQKHVLNGEILVNNKIVKSGYKLKENDRIEIQIQKETIIHIQPEKIPLNIIFEDQNLIVIDKPAGMVVHPGAGNSSGTLVNALMYHCADLSTLGGNTRPGIVHRLDKNTSGLLVVAKDDETHRKLQNQFITKDIHRTYYALIWGRPPNKEGEIETLISRSRNDRKKMAVSSARGKEAITHYELLIDFQYLSLLKIKLKTGRTHQIRVHLNHSNMPVFGDPVYNGRKSQLRRLPSHLQRRGAAMLKKINRQALHAKELSFIHPTTAKKLDFFSELPEDIDYLLKNIKSTLLLNS